MSLPDFPVDDSTLDLLSIALDPGPDAERTSLAELLVLLSELGGSDTAAVESTIYLNTIADLPPDLAADDPESTRVDFMRDPQYHEHDAIRALIAEVRRLRVAVEEATDD